MDDYDNNKSEQWDWHGEDYCARKDPNLEISEALWNGVPQNQEDISYMFDETTPVKACGDLAYQFSQRDDRTKMAQGSRETSSQVKRRRMLQFDTRPSDPFLCNEDISTQLFKSNERDDLIVEDLPEASNATSGCTMLSDNASTFCYENLDQSSEEWIAECFNDTGMHFSPEELNFPGDANVHIDISEFCDTPTSYEANVAQQRTTRAPLNIVLKGRKSYIRTPTKLASSVAYPFAFIKPCGVHGDVTLKDINQWIRTPPPSKSKKSEEDPESYPTSAFSGKPVVGKTKIHTEGGKGSITIMRTKG